MGRSQKRSCLKVDANSAVVVAHGNSLACGLFAYAGNKVIGVEVQVGIELGVDRVGPGHVLEGGEAGPVSGQLVVGSTDSAFPPQLVLAPPFVLAISIKLEGHGGRVLDVPFHEGIKLPLRTLQDNLNLVALHVIVSPFDGGGQVLAVGKLDGVADFIVTPGGASSDKFLAIQSDLSLLAIASFLNRERGDGIGIGSYPM